MFQVSVIFSADLGSTECGAVENQASFTQPVIVHPEIDIEVSEVCFVISISKCGWNSRWKKMQHIVNIQKKKKKFILKVFPSLL